MSVIGAAIVGQQTGRMTQPRAHQILVRRNAEHAREQPQEMERADAGLPAAPVQIDLLMRMRIDPQRGFDRAAPIPGGRSNRLARAAWKPPRQNGLRTAVPISSSPKSLRPSAAACASSPITISSGNGGAAPICQIPPPPPIASTSSGPRKNDRHSSPQNVIVRADIFVAGMADQNRARYQFERMPAAMVAEAALAHIGD